jgi:integrase
MPTLRLTDASLDRLILPDGSDDIFYNDDELGGFKARVRRDARGRVRRTWHVQYRSKTGKQARVSLGNVDKPAQLSATKARQKAAEILVSVRAGDDPQKARKAAKADRKRLLLDEAMRYLEDRRTGVIGKRPMRPSTFNSAMLHFKVHFAALARRPVADITASEVNAELRKIIERCGKIAAVRARSNLHSFYTWAAREGIARSNPVFETHQIAVNAPRDRVLSDDEIRSVWSACRDDDFGRIIKLLLFSGARRGEIGGLMWNEIDFRTGVLTIPATRTKAARELRLTLPPAALDVLRDCPRKGDRPFLFGERGGAYNRWGMQKALLDQRIAAAGHHLAPWGLHDLRRTAATRMAAIGVQPHVVELVLNHAGPKQGLGRTYNQHPYAGEIADALARWSRALMAIVNPGGEPSNVVQIRTKETLSTA